MKAVVVEDGSGALQLVERPVPAAADGEIVIAVSATAVNRADLLQAAGRYPPPHGATDVLGLECAGVVSAVGRGVHEHRVGDPVMALLAGGGYAEATAVPAAHVMPVPPSMSLHDAAAVPEAFLTAWRALVHLAPVAPGERVLIHAAASGVGVGAIQIARELGAEVIGTVRSAGKAGLVDELGAHPLVVGADGFAGDVERLTAGAGVDVVVDLVGAAYWQDTVACLAEGARVALVGLLGGARTEVDLSALMRLQAQVAGGTLRSRGSKEKADLVQEFTRWGLPRLGDGRMRPIVAATLPLSAVQESHELVARNAPAGKVVLTTGL